MKVKENVGIIIHVKAGGKNWIYEQLKRKVANNEMEKYRTTDT